MKIAGLIMGLTLACGSSALAQSTRPSAAPAPKPVDRNALNVRANEAFSTGQYALALPLLQKVEATEKDDPTAYGATAEQIRVCQANLALPPSPPANNNAAGANDVVPMAPETRHPHLAPKPGQVLELSIKELGNFEYDQDNGGGIPDDVKRLNGSTVRLMGFMVPSDQAENITQFALVPSLFSCCYGQPPQIQHTIMVNCPPGKEVSYFPDPIVIEGKLTVDEKKDDGYIVSIFTVDVSSVKPAPK